MTRKATSPTKETPPLAEALPWLCLASPEWMLCKDGSLLAGFQYQGVDFDNRNESDCNAALHEMRRGIEALDSRFYMWWVIDKRRDFNFAANRSEFPNKASQAIDDIVASGYERGEYFTLTFRVFVMYTGETGLYGYMESVRRMVNEDGRSMLSAMLASANPSAIGNKAALRDARQLDANLFAAEEGTRKFLDAQSQMKFQRLSGWDLENSLIQSANITLPTSTSYKPPVGTLLDGYASLSDVTAGREILRVAGPNKTVVAANLTLKNYAENTASRELDAIMAMPIEYRVTHVVRCLGREGTRKAVTEGTKYYEMNRLSFFQRAMARATGSSPQPAPGKQELYEECLAAQAQIMSTGLGFVYHALTITLIESDVASLEKRVTEVSRVLNTVAFIRERLGLKASFKSSMPGSWSQQKRLQLINAEVCADCLPLITVSSGDEVSPYMSSLYDKPMPALTVAKTRFSTTYNYNPHAGQLGHTLVVMPSGNGKTTFVNYCLSQFQRYPDAQVVIFDRDWSCRILTGLVGGKHIDVKSQDVKLNPMAAIKEGEMGRLWAREFLLRIIEDGGCSVSSDERNQIDETLLNFSKVEGVQRLNDVAHMLPVRLQSALKEWTEGGPYAMFDSKEDDLSISSWTAIEMKELMGVDRLARAFMDHCFRVLSKQLGSRPTFIYLEEASFLLNSPTFLKALDDWLKTFRKLNAFVWMTIQSPQSISGVGDESVRATITDNIPNLILGYNKKLENHRELYRKMFAMEDEQIDLIGELKPKRDYLQISDGFCRVMRTNFNDDLLAYLRSEMQYQDLFTKAMSSGRADWREWYIEQAMSRR